MGVTKHFKEVKGQAKFDGSSTTTGIVFSGSGGQAYGLADNWCSGSGGYLKVEVGDGHSRYIQLFTGTVA